MPPDATPPHSPAEALRQQQDALAAYIRDPTGHPPPPGIEERRLKIYRELFFNNVSGMLAGNFPVVRRILGDDAWQALVRGFFRDHDSRTPLFTELAREFLRYLQAPGLDDGKPWLRELAHYEWIELALQISEASDAQLAHDALRDPGSNPELSLLSERPALSPLAWPLAYAWPVHMLGPGHLPEDAPTVPTFLLVHRQASGKVAFHELSPLTFRLLQRLDEAPELSGREHLVALAGEAGRPDVDAFIAEGAAMLLHWWEAGVVLGVHRDGDG
ncbi:DNA-binding domain-containing protein [Luteimonas vadosa]|uniref:DUF2063 domain-containing protein n=1 Tax=Luteimonas vadosa TaxID=1165507 RepID=A0ABP9E185_9GAMM